MENFKAIGGCFLAFIILCLGVGMVGDLGGGLSGITPQFAGAGEEIRMVQPNGWWWTRDKAYSEVNHENAGANKLNGERHLLDAQAQEASAQATKTVAEAQVILGQAQAKGMAAGVPLGILLAIGGALLLIVLGIIVFYNLTNRT